MDGYIEKQTLQDIADAIRAKNGSSDTYKPSEMAEAIRGIEGGGEGFDLMQYGESKEFQDDFNNLLAENIQYTIDWFEQNKNVYNATTIGAYNKRLLFVPNIELGWRDATQSLKDSGIKLIDNVKFIGEWNNAFQNVTLMRFPEILDFTNVTSGSEMFRGSFVTNQKKEELIINFGNGEIKQIWGTMFRDFHSNIPMKLKFIGNRLSRIYIMFRRDSGYATFHNFPQEFEYEESYNITALTEAFRNNTGIKKISLGSVEKCATFQDWLTSAPNVEVVKMQKWCKASILIASCSKLTTSSIRYIIWHALNGENTLGFENEGATSRTFKLHATPYASWEEWKTTKPSVEDCEFLGVDETEITKYGELTWEDIALSIKLITIGA